MAFRYPLDNVRITQGFGTGGDSYSPLGHNGIDLGAPLGTPVYAADDGTVSFEGWGQNHSWMLSPAGICVLINHGGSYGGYAHLSSTVVSKGQKVNKGQVIGYVGSTGNSTGPHLHFEMLPLSPNFKNGYAGRINPMPYIATVNNATDDQIRQAFRDILERELVNDADLVHYRQYTNEFVRQDLNNSQEKRTLDLRKSQEAEAAALKSARDAADAKAAQEAIDAANRAAAEQARIKAEEEAARLAAEEKAKSVEAIVKENNGLLKWIVALLKKIFNIQ